MNDTPYNTQVWNTTLQKYIQEGHIPEQVTTLIEHVAQIKIQTLQHQLFVLSSISNYHWWQFIRCDGEKRKSGIHVRLTDHLLYHPSSEDSDEELTLKYIPQSPRNRLMYYMYKESMYPGCLRSSITELLKIDNKEDNAIGDDIYLNNQPSKRRQIATHVLKVTPDKYGVELSNVLQSSLKHGFGNQCVGFVEYLVDQAIMIHQGDIPVQEPSEIVGSYNPESGTVYYFTPLGHQVRKQPVYSIDQERKNYHNLPTVDDLCKKQFPNVSYGGFGYIFLWFCPIHGHCYGFHLISGGEGRKDPFSSLFKYMPEAPTDIFYDFACQLSEYCLNREPQYFLHTRFWHDLFHGITHKCGKCFKSSRVCGMVGINSEICEQFNSYLQCIKYTGSHLSQSHFMFFVQFFIYLWNQEKTAKFENIIGIALAGAQ